MRRDSRRADEIRPLTLQRPYSSAAPGSVLVRAGQTVVLCTAGVEAAVPAWMAGKGRGWITAEYGMLPGSTSPRKPRERAGKLDGRSSEIQRLIGRSLRAIIDLSAIGERTIAIDCDVLSADGGTRTLSVTGAYVALVDALRSIQSHLPNPDQSPLLDSVAAVSVGLFDGQLLLDLDYSEDSRADVDMNVVMSGRGRFIEVQGTGERTTFSDEDLSAMLRAARQGIAALSSIQREALGPGWPLV